MSPRVTIGSLKRRGTVQIALITIEGALQATAAENYKQQDAQKEDMSKRVIAHLDTLVLQSASTGRTG